MTGRLSVIVGNPLTTAGHASISGEFEDTIVLLEVLRIRKLKKNRQHNDQKKKDKQRSTKHKTKDRVTRTPLRSGE